jgi:hypothetical protein
MDVQHEIQLEMDFSSKPNLYLGDPVLYNGKVIGSVTKISSPQIDADLDTNRLDMKSSSTRVSLRLSSGAIPMEEKLVGLASTTKLSNSTPHSSSGLVSKSFIDIVNLSKNSSSTSNLINSLPNNSLGNSIVALRGFSSFQEFWSSSSL